MLKSLGESSTFENVLKAIREGTSLISVGRSFHVVGSAMEKSCLLALSPLTLEKYVQGDLPDMVLTG